MHTDKAMGVQAIEDLYPKIAQEAIDTAGSDLAGRLMVYAEVEEGAISADILYVNRSGDVQLVLGPEHLVGLVYELWQRWSKQWGEWRVMSFVVDEDNHFRIDVLGPDEVDVEEDVTDRRPRAVEKYFGKVNVIEPEFEVEDES